MLVTLTEIIIAYYISVLYSLWAYYNMMALHICPYINALVYSVLQFAYSHLIDRFVLSLTQDNFHNDLIIRDDSSVTLAKLVFLQNNFNWMVFFFHKVLFKVALD